MMVFRSPGAIALACALLTPAAGRAAAPGRPVPVPKLIDELVKVGESDYGYSPWATGSRFLPLDRAGEFHVGVWGKPPPVASDTMRALVKRGAEAVPHLVAHLGDRRTTRVVIKPFANPLSFERVADYNARTDPDPGLKGDEGMAGPGTTHKVTVGDLCFVALGQIVNRGYQAVRYQPSGLVYINSPTSSKALHDAVKKRWAGLTPARHRASLIADVLKPDDEGRRIGACKRLAFYYPDALEPLALKLLARPTYPLFQTQSFVRETLYRTADARKRRELFNAFVAKHGEPAREGILLQLFEDLDLLEANEQKRLFPPLEEFGDQPRRLLIELYGKGKKVRSTERSKYPDALSDVGKARLIEEGLIHDRSVKVDQSVRKVLLSVRAGDDLALACMRRLVGRGYDADIEKYCRRRLPALPREDRKPLQEMLDRLGWTRLHVAVERQDRDGVRRLLGEGADPDAKARDGTAPLHLAAGSGDARVVRALLGARPRLDVPDRDGLTPVQRAVREDHEEVVRLLLAAGCAAPDILVASAAGRKDLVEAFLKKDARQVSARTRHKQTPLHPAAEALLAHKADLRAKDDEGRTPLALAKKSNRMVELLRKHGARE
jgi:hypothetical protein